MSGALFLYPFLAELLNANDGSHRCLGTLIASDMVLTAAHCLYDTEVLVRLAATTVAGGTLQKIFVVQSAWTHPSYYYNTYTGGIDVDPYDAALLQLYGSGVHVSSSNGTSRSFSDVVRLYRNGTVLPLKVGKGQGPSAEPNIDQQLVGLGWNENGNETVERTRLGYIPNDVCLLVNETTDEGLDVSFASQVIDVTLCATYEEGPGLCPGDSGGPIFLFDNSTSTSVQALAGQVGITSASYGCSNKRLPTLNVRVSKVVEWIDTVVCNASLYSISEDFGCSSNGWHDPANRTMADLTMQLDLGSTPMNLGWILYQVLHENGHRQLVPRGERHVQFYRSYAANTTVSESLEVPSESLYKLLLLDVGEEPSSSTKLLQVVSSGSPVEEWVTNNQRGMEIIQFTLGSKATAVPYTSVPTTPPTRSENATFLSVVIFLDDFPTETGFLVEDLDEKIDDGESLPVLYACYPGTFGSEMAQKEVQLIVPLPTYVERVRFTMTDNEGDGLDPPGYYELWLGRRSNGTLGAKGGVFYLEDSHELSIPAGGYFDVSQLPSSPPPSTIQWNRPTFAPLSAPASVEASIASGYATFNCTQLPILAIAGYLLLFLVS